MLFDTLRKIVEETPGATGAILMGFDGIAVMQYLAKGHEQSGIEEMAMEFSYRFMELRRAAKALDMGEVSDITVKAEAGTVLCRVLSEEYFAAVVMHDGAHFGKGRWLLRSNAAELSSEL
ncbi:roadblock/LC7 domain-containing protein [Paraliomyxa miuraensis]|uniref:roadblock/LC7 domain-containing protein n=1 Tax=Paraliomyxa miuraensis TaxID=376150 RepID=UPI00224E9979|nr:roadblock/LC7 domain-containing protein [Paraliomyxa miuraensis]MCX4240285.1 roadblock/LC7 domain-containing protein [Paraliomyxa miuraensis]